MVEHVLGKDGVTGSIPVSSSVDELRGLNGEPTSEAGYPRTSSFTLAKPNETAGVAEASAEHEVRGAPSPASVKVREASDGMVGLRCGPGRGRKG